jgi:hypothetical protein
MADTITELKKLDKSYHSSPEIVNSIKEQIKIISTLSTHDDSYLVKGSNTLEDVEVNKSTEIIKELCEEMARIVNYNSRAPSIVKLSSSTSSKNVTGK